MSYTVDDFANNATALYQWGTIAITAISLPMALAIAFQMGRIVTRWFYLHYEFDAQPDIPPVVNLEAKHEKACNEWVARHDYDARRLRNPAK